MTLFDEAFLDDSKLLVNSEVKLNNPDVDFKDKAQVLELIKDGYRLRKHKENVYTLSNPARITTQKVKKYKKFIWQRQDDIIDIFPETEKFYKEKEKREHGKGCSNCAESKLRLAILYRIKENIDDKEDSDIIKILKKMTEVLPKKQPFIDCEECVEKHLSTALVLCTEVIEGHEEKRQEMYAELREASKEGWRVRYKGNKYKTLRDVILDSLGISEPLALAIGHLAKAEQYIEQKDQIIAIRNIRREIQPSATKIKKEK